MKRAKKQKKGTFLSQSIATLASFSFFLYFFYHLIHGDHGYFAWKGIEKKLQLAEDTFKNIQQKRKTQASQVKMLRPDSLDQDMLDERARAVLGFVHPEEVVILERR